MTHPVRGSRRVWLPAAFLGLFALVVFARLIQLQILQHPEYAERAKAELQGGGEIYARRGSILDRNGNVMAASVDTWDVYVNRRAWQDDADAKPAAEELAKALQQDPTQKRRSADELLRLVRSTEQVDVLIARDLEYEAGQLLMKSDSAGIITLRNTRRINPEGDVAASVLGIIGQDNIGLAGIELQYNEQLQGKAGQAIFEQDTTGDPIPFGQHVASDPEPGKDLVLTIDRYMQQAAEEALAKAVEEHKATGGAIIVMDPKTGEIMAMATLPRLTYTGLKTLDLSTEQGMSRLKNVAVSDLYEPGSVMKIITAAAAIDQGEVTPDTTYTDTGVAYIYDVPIHNWKDGVYGTQTMTGVLQQSINTGAIFMVEKLGQERFHRYLEAFGFGQLTGIDMAGESEGIIRRPTDPDWSPVDLATQSFGQSISVTPVQMAAAVAAVINGGNYVTPHLVKATIDADGRREDLRTAPVRKVISEQTSATMREMLHQVVTPPEFGHPGKPKLYTAGGKSGTANVPIPNGYDERHVASFIGFAPYDDPEILVLVKLDENADLLTGTQAASPVFSKLADELLTYMNVRPDAAKYASTR